MATGARPPRLATSLVVCFVKDNQTIGEVRWQTDFPVHLIAQQMQLGYTHLAEACGLHRNVECTRRHMDVTAQYRVEM